MAKAEVRVGNVWLSGVGNCGDLEWSTRWPGGSFEASWRMHLPDRVLPAFLRSGQNTAIRVGTKRVWRGRLTRPVPQGGKVWQFTAEGLFRQGERFHAFNGSGASTSVPNTAIDTAIGNGLPWTRSQSFSAAAMNDVEETEGLQTVSALLDAWANEAGESWGVDVDGRVFHAPDSSTPGWHISPIAGPNGTAEEEYASHVVGRYLRTSDSTYQTVWATGGEPFGRAEALVDLTVHGPMTTSRAQAYVDKILVKGRARLGWTDAIELDRYEITTPGGVPADLRFVRAGQVARQFGVIDPDTGRITHKSFVIGEAKFREGSGLISIAPAKKSVSNLAEAIERVTQARST